MDETADARDAAPGDEDDADGAVVGHAVLVPADDPAPGLG